MYLLQEVYVYASLSSNNSHFLHEFLKQWFPSQHSTNTIYDTFSIVSLNQRILFNTLYKNYSHTNLLFSFPFTSSFHLDASICSPNISYCFFSRLFFGDSTAPILLFKLLSLYFILSPLLSQVIRLHDLRNHVENHHFQIHYPSPKM